VAAGRRLLELAGVPVPVTDPATPEPVPAGTPGLALHRARLRYGPDLPWALHDVTFEAPSGTRTAVVGASGAGKSSVVHALLRFWPLSSGSASLGGTPVDRLAQADVRRAVALVDQDARLFAGSLRDNVVLGRPDAQDEEVARALRLAQLEAWVATLPEGLATPVGEQGARVSGGQRRRIALARALLTGAPVLVLDEPTAGLDQETAGRLLADVLAAGDHRTVLMITHREEDLAGFDRVVVMDRGRVVRGS
ncbi:MAG: amino acid ABC transporter ATP-binding/permease protein, partial [Acidimicrobiales bacterium]